MQKATGFEQPVASSACLRWRYTAGGPTGQAAVSRQTVIGLPALGLVFSRWNVTVSGLIVPLNYALGTLFQVTPADYTPSLIEWGVIIGVLGYVMLLFTVAVYFLPIFEYDDGEAH